MSEWIKLLNALKQERKVSLLTVPQREAYEQLCRIMDTPEWVNLSGPLGSGKTFVAWAVARAIGATYLPLPSQLNMRDRLTSALIIDNAPHQARKIRALLAHCDMLGVRTVLLITRRPAGLPMSAVSLPAPTPVDIAQMGYVIDQLGYFFEAERLPARPNFWDVLLASI